MAGVESKLSDAGGVRGLLDRRTTVLLVDDQAIVGEAVQQALAGEGDLELHFCQDPERAIAMANTLHPTVILQDLVMPEVDGLMLVKFFRANPATRQTPMIVLSSKEDPVIKARAFALGANDYLVKLPDRIELIARIRYHSRSYLNLLERNEAYRQLEESRRFLADELAQAARYVTSLLPKKLSGAVQTDWRFVPSTQLAGDMFGYHWLDKDHLAVYLLDVSGHGVGSALLAVSAGNLLSAQSLPDVDFREPGRVLARLNDLFPMEKQGNQYFTMWYGVYDRVARTLTWSNAGHPDALLFTGPDAGSAALLRLDSSGPGVGMIPDWEFETKVCALGSYARLLVYSDGAYEIERPDRTMWKFAEFVEYVEARAAGDGPVLDVLLEHARGLRGSDVLADDFSIVEMRF